MEVVGREAGAEEAQGHRSSRTTTRARVAVLLAVAATVAAARVEVEMVAAG